MDRCKRTERGSVPEKRTGDGKRNPEKCTVQKIREDVSKLNKHPYVKKASEWTVSFTSEFKRLAYEEYCGGKSMKRIFKEAGFDVGTLGEQRLQNFRNKLIAKADSESGFDDGRNANRRKETQSTEALMVKRIRELEHRNAYLEQENDFLKKYRQRKRTAAGKRK